MNSVSLRQKLLAGALAAAGLLALAVAAREKREQAILFEDERHFLAAAASLANRGALSFGAPGSGGERSLGVLREPGYPALLALSWKAAGVAPPASAVEVDAVPSDPSRYRPIRAAQLALLAVAAAASAWAVGRLRGPVAGALAGALVAASPALQRATTTIMSEVFTAALVACFAALLVALVTKPSRPAFGLLIAVTALLPLVRAEAIVLLPVALGFVIREREELAERRGWVPVLLFLALAPAPAVAWMARNSTETRHFVLSDRGGLAIAVRAALDHDVARFGARAALLAFTPVDAARRKALELEPESTLLDHRPEGSDNFLLRTYREFNAERARPGADQLEVDSRLGRAALRGIAARPGRHLATAAVVGWRGLFAERSPAWSHPFDLTLALGLMLGGGFAVLFVWSVFRRDIGALALLAPGAALAAFHVAVTEFLPRYAVPLLPAFWAALVVLAFTLREERAAAGSGSRTASPARAADRR